MESPLKELAKLEKLTAKSSVKGKTHSIPDLLDSLLQSLDDAKDHIEGGTLLEETLIQLSQTIEARKKEVDERQKEVYSSLSRFGKALDKVSSPVKLLVFVWHLFVEIPSISTYTFKPFHFWSVCCSPRADYCSSFPSDRPVWYGRDVPRSQPRLYIMDVQCHTYILIPGIRNRYSSWITFAVRWSPPHPQSAQEPGYQPGSFVGVAFISKFMTLKQSDSQMGQKEPSIFAISFLTTGVSPPSFPVYPSALILPPPKCATSLILCERHSKTVLQWTCHRVQASLSLLRIPPIIETPNFTVCWLGFALSALWSGAIICEGILCQLGNEQAGSVEGRGGYWRRRRLSKNREGEKSDEGKKKWMESDWRTTCSSLSFLFVFQHSCQNAYLTQIEIPLPAENRYHSIFACPVSKEQSTEQNPPMMMGCGHVITKDSLLKLSKPQGWASSYILYLDLDSTDIYALPWYDPVDRRVKCPYCPTESQMGAALRVYFWVGDGAYRGLFVSVFVMLDESVCYEFNVMHAWRMNDMAREMVRYSTYV